MVRKGFSLVELIIVTAVISLLIGISLPALMYVKNQAEAAVCQQNLRTLSVAWLMYKDDNDDRIVGGDVGKYPYDWVQGPTGTGTARERHQEGIRQGALFHYLSHTVDVYRCPGDTRLLATDQRSVRSYSIAGGANGELWYNSYAPVIKYSQITRPGQTHIFVEEADPRGWNKGSWVVNPLAVSWVDPLAVWHNGNRSSLGFADGHSDGRRWVDQSTIDMCRKQEFFYPVAAGEGEDLQFMVNGFPRSTTDGVPSS